MRKTLRSFITTIAVAATVMLGAGTAQAVDLPAVTDTYIFNTSLGNFQTIRAQRPYDGQLDWSSDGCSWSPDKPLGWEFVKGCYRHDFGYRNYKKQGRWNQTNRKRIDDKLYSDLLSLCGGNVICKGTAWTYYQAVRKFGN